MGRQTSAWLIVTALLAAGLGLGGLVFRARDELPVWQEPIARMALGSAMALAALVLLVVVIRRRAPELAADEPERCRLRPFCTLFLISFVALFVELMLIRYCSSQVRIFAFYKNVPLIGSFLGLGLGCCLSRGGPRQAFSFVLWLVPFTALLTSGAVVVAGTLGKFAALGTSEHLLGDFVPTEERAALRWLGLAVVAMVCVGTLVVITLLFALVGRLLGGAFERVTRIPGYTVNIVGSLTGILVFVLLSYLQTPPWLWFIVGLGPLVWWAPGRGPAVALALLALANAGLACPGYGKTVWSPYQKLVGHAIEVPGEIGTATGYQVEISDVFYQVSVDRRPETLRRTGTDPYPHYDAVYERLPHPGRVLIVGAGTGNDVAAALRAGAERIDAVDIDAAILELGRQHHPERPYDDPRVRLIVDDARHAFRLLEPGSYDTIVFGLLDSHTQLGISSVRLDNYVFTLESLEAAAKLVRPGGHVVITAATFTNWFRDRLTTMLRRTVDGPVHVFRNDNWFSYIASVGGSLSLPDARLPSAEADLPTDDWPFLYLPRKGIPGAYQLIVALLAAASLLVLRVRGLRIGSFSAEHLHLFFLGAGFLLMEVHAINRLALLFGTTWIVSAVAIAIVLLLIVGANLVVLATGGVPYRLSYVLLALSLGLSFWIRPDDLLGQATFFALGFGVLLLSPVFFAGLVFARSFAASRVAATAIGANILGCVLGGWVEYATMAFGVRALLLLAGAFYACSLISLRRVAGAEADGA